MASNNFDLDSFQSQVINAVDVISFSEKLEQSQAQPQSGSFKETKKEAEEIVARGNVKKIICESLKSPTDDAIDLAQNITPALVGAVLAGTITIPLNPIIFGWIALLVFKISVNAYCSTH